MGAIIRRFNRTLKTKIYKYFTKNNKYSYLDVMGKHLSSYTNSVHFTIYMPPSKVNPSKIYFVWQGMNNLRSNIPQGRVKFKVGHLVRITKEKVKFAKGYKQTFSTELYLGLSKSFSRCSNLFTRF